MDQPTRGEAARMLLDAYATGKPIAPLTTTYADLTLEDAYAIQLLQIEELTRAGRTIKGHKVGLTSAAMQRMLGVNEPDFGHLLDDFFYLEHA
ncbi:MAG: 2-keto-4-pentenoate hydratase, partial [Pseudonocardiaceae bacterium]